MSRIDVKLLKDTDSKLKTRYSERFEKFGQDPRSLGWDTKSNQHVRYRTAVNSVDLSGHSILDVGCGLADFYDYLEKNDVPIKKYTGMDIIPGFIESCANRHTSSDFMLGNLLIDGPQSNSFDTICMFGLLNFRFSEFDNEEFAKDMIEEAFKVSNKSVIVDMLSAHVDSSYPKEDFVFYYDPAKMLEFALTLTPHVQLIHDYESIPQREFTLVLRKGA